MTMTGNSKRLCWRRELLVGARQSRQTAELSLELPVEIHGIVGPDGVFRR